MRISIIVIKSWVMEKRRVSQQPDLKYYPNPGFAFHAVHFKGIIAHSELSLLSLYQRRQVNGSTVIPSKTNCRNTDSKCLSQFAA